MRGIELNSTITCPECGFSKTEECQPTLASGIMNVNLAKFS